jgi:heme A synthase
MDTPLTPATAEPTEDTGSRAKTATALMASIGTLLMGCAAMTTAWVGSAEAQHACTTTSNPPTMYASGVLVDAER